jgi:hypothetical protein
VVEECGLRFGEIGVGKVKGVAVLKENGWTSDGGLECRRVQG